MRVSLFILLLATFWSQINFSQCYKGGEEWLKEENVDNVTNKKTICLNLQSKKISLLETESKRLIGEINFSDIEEKGIEVIQSGKYSQITIPLKKTLEGSLFLILYCNEICPLKANSFAQNLKNAIAGNLTDEDDNTTTITADTAVLINPPGETMTGSSNIYYRTPSNSVENTVQIYRSPKFVPVESKKVSFNLMWINKNINPEEKFIGGMVTRENRSFIEIFQEQVAKWMLLNPKSNVVLWFDSLMSTKEQVEATKKTILQFLLKIKEKNPELEFYPNKFMMKDVRRLKIVKKFPQAFTEDIPIYTRVNSLRLIAAVETNEALSSQRINGAFVYADYVVNPHSFEDVYPGIPTSGFMAIRSQLSKGYENSFMILGNQNKYTLGSIRDLVVLISNKLYSKFSLKERQYGLFIFFDDYMNENLQLFHTGHLYDCLPNTLFIAKVREDLKTSPVEFINIEKDPKGTKYSRPYLNFCTRKFDTDFRILGYNLNFKEGLFDKPENYVAVIDDPRVTITRVSGHGDNGVRISAPVKIEDIIKSLKRKK